MGYPRATKEQLADRSRYKFTTRELDIPELELSVECKTLSADERDELPDLVEPVVDADGKPVVDDQGNLVQRPIASVDNLAEVWATVVSDPKLSAEEVKAFAGDLPAPALDRVIVQFGELLSTDKKANASQNGKADEEGAEIRRDFRPVPDGPPPAV